MKLTRCHKISCFFWRLPLIVKELLTLLPYCSKTTLCLHATFHCHGKNFLSLPQVARKSWIHSNLMSFWVIFNLFYFSDTKLNILRKKFNNCFSVALGHDVHLSEENELKWKDFQYSKLTQKLWIEKINLSYVGIH